MLLSEHFHTRENLNFIYNPWCAYRFFLLKLQNLRNNVRLNMFLNLSWVFHGQTSNVLDHALFLFFFIFCPSEEMSELHYMDLSPNNQ